MPGRGHAVVRLDVLRHVLGEDADAVALAGHAEQRVREPERPLVQAAEADLAVVDDERGAVRRLLRVQPDDVSEKHAGSPRVRCPLLVDIRCQVWASGTLARRQRRVKQVRDVVRAEEAR